VTHPSIGRSLRRFSSPACRLPPLDPSRPIPITPPTPVGLIPDACSLSHPISYPDSLSKLPLSVRLVILNGASLLLMDTCFSVLDYRTHAALNDGVRLRGFEVSVLIFSTFEFRRVWRILGQGRGGPQDAKAAWTACSISSARWRRIGAAKMRFRSGVGWSDKRNEVGGWVQKRCLHIHTVIVSGRGLILAETTDRKELTLSNDTEDLTERPRVQWVGRI
jgi:hypothetical protein